MSSDPTLSSEESAEPKPAAAATRRAPTWAIVGLLVLFGVGYVWTNYNAHSGPPVAWTYNLDEALEKAKNEKKRVFLMLYQKGDSVAEGLDRNLFTLTSVRETLAQMVPCRVEVAPNDPLRNRFRVTELPHCFTLDASGNILESRLKGSVDELQFRTYVKPK